MTCPQAAVVLCAALGVTAAAAAQPPRGGAPALPALSLEALPPPVRATLSAAYDAARARPTDASAIGRLAMMLHAYDQHRAAHGCYRIARALDGRSLPWTYLSGVVEADLGEYRVAADSLRAALRIDPDYLPARVRLAEALLQDGDLEASRAEYAAIVRDLPELALAHYGLGRILSVRGDTTEAVEHYQRAVHVAPEFGSAHYALALSLRDAGLADRARPHLDAYRRFGARRPAVRDPLMAEVRALRETARDLLAEASRLNDAGRLEEAIALHLKALEADPASAQAHVNLISLYGRTANAAKAEEHYRAAIALGGSLADAHYNYGVLLASARRHDEAAAVFRQTLDIDPFHAPAHHNLASLLAQQKRFDEAEAHYRQALANDPQHLNARVNLGRVLALLGRRQEAAAQLRLALDRAERLGQRDLAAAIRKELQKLD